MKAWVRNKRAVTRFLINIATSGQWQYTGKKEFGMSDYLIRYVLMNSIAVLGFVFLVLFTIVNIFAGAYNDAVFCGAASLICPLMLFLARTKMPQIIPAAAMMVMYGTLCVILTRQGDAAGGFFFIYLYPSLTFMILGMTWGVILSAALLALICLVVFVPGIAPIVYNGEIAARMVAAYFLVFFIMIVVEITRKTKDRLIERQNRRLEELRIKAEAANQSKSSFLATMSHEIRTPLNAIIGLSEIELRGELSPESKKNIAQVYQSGSSLLAIVNDILDISKIESGNFELILADYETASLMSDTVKLNMVRIGSKPIVFKLEIDASFPRSLRGDELRVKRILGNVLSNAFKYTREGSVTLAVDCERRGETQALLRFTVRDTGIGIRQEDLGRLFADYTQLDTRANRMIEGTGLGLAITKKLVEMMDGSITVESEFGKGSVFTVELVQEFSDPEPIGEEIADRLRTFRYARFEPERDFIHAPMPYGKVLVVDDMAVNLLVAKGLLAPYGLWVDTASSGREAVEKIRKEDPRYDLVFMDHMMPNMDGVEAVRIIREELGTGYNRDLPIIALTANAVSGMREMFLDKGFNGFISKPIDSVQLDEALNRWIGNKKQATERVLPQAGARKGIAAIPGVNIKQGIAMTGGTEAGYREVLALFRKDALERLPFLRNFAAQEMPGEQNLALFVTQVHALKSASASIGAAEVSAEAARLEAAGKAADLALFRQTLPAFAERLAALAAGIAAALPAPEEPSATYSPLPAPLLKELAAALETQNAENIDRLLEEILQQPLDPESREILDKVSESVLMAEYENAVELIKDL